MFFRLLQIIVLVLLVALLTVWAAPVCATVDDLMSQGEKLFRNRMDLSQAEKSAALFRQAMKMEPGDPEPAWKLARSLCWLAEKTKDDKKRRLAISSEAVKAAQTAVALAPDQAAPHFFLGLSWVYYGDTKGIYEVASRWKEVKAEFEKVIELEPGYMGGASYMLLARAYYYVPEFMGGGREHALEYYQKALEYGPRQFGTHIYLAEHYINEGDLYRARELLKQVLAGPPMEGQEPEWEEWKGEAEHYMRKVKEKEARLR